MTDGRACQSLASCVSLVPQIMAQPVALPMISFYRFKIITKLLFPEIGFVTILDR
jgi:hypothetical protein